MAATAARRSRRFSSRRCGCRPVEPDAALPRLRCRSQQVSFPAKKTGGGAMGWRGTGAALAIAVLIAPGARAATFKWANDGDARAMDPYTFNETVQNSLLANIYERLVQPSKQTGIGARPGGELGDDRAERLALSPAAERQMAGRHAVHRRRRGVLVSAGSRGKNSAKRSPGRHGQGGAQGRRPDRRYRDQRTRPDPALRDDRDGHHVQGVVRGARRGRERRVRQGRELRADPCDGNRAVPARLARARPQDRGREEPELVGQARAAMSTAPSST